MAATVVSTVVNALAVIIFANACVFARSYAILRVMELLTVAELADLLKLKRGTLDRWRAANLGPAWIEVGGQFRYRREDVDAWLAERTKGAAERA